MLIPITLEPGFENCFYNLQKTRAGSVIYEPQEKDQHRFCNQLSSEFFYGLI